ncbi:Transposon Ty3-G Gag-Pol polyprotein [Gossypium australe]|uniref:Transposon Ty3-G Gag-Pol polyprotein n=1 Tax=Gossypium australe TaxID=47621 RepID=A0A5B6X328_9ROSI|nr:Transposon Ty3-G Gag-Pol polyprotein [Gossypium australe]
MLRSCVVDFCGSWEEFLPLAMAPYEALYSCTCCTLLCWTELGDKKIMGLDMVIETEDKLQTDRNLMRILRGGKLSLVWGIKFFLRYLHGKRFYGLAVKSSCKQVGPVTYQLQLPPDLDCPYDVFCVSLLRWYWFDSLHIVLVEEIKLRLNLSFEEDSV